MRGNTPSTTATFAFTGSDNRTPPAGLTFEQEGFPATNLVDNNRANGWALAPKLGGDHAVAEQHLEDGRPLLVAQQGHQELDVVRIARVATVGRCCPVIAAMTSLVDVPAQALANMSTMMYLVSASVALRPARYSHVR